MDDISSIEAPVLVVDLDGALCRTDTLHEALVRLAASQPLRLFPLARALLSGRVAFKRYLSEHSAADTEWLPYNPHVIELLKQAREDGRRTVLVSDADQATVDAVAEHIGLFDDAFGSGGLCGRNCDLKGDAKANFLIARYGDGGFDYVGTSPEDLSVWKHAKRAIGVLITQRLKDVAAREGVRIDDISSPTGAGARLRQYLRAMRPHQWSKNLLILLPVAASHDLSHLREALVAVVAFSLLASSVYIINDLIDLNSDRRHPRKRNRPFASGLISAAEGIKLAGVLFVAAVVLAALFTPKQFLLCLAVYFALTCAYSAWLKKKLLLDVITLAGLYTMRIAAGSAATGIALSPWLLVFSMFLFVSLATIKRQAEVSDQLRANKVTVPGRAYVADDLPILRCMAVCSGQASVLVLALYVNSLTASQLYETPELLWVACVVLFYWLSRMAVLTDRGFMHDDPIVFAARDRISLAAAAIVIAIAAIAVKGW